MANAVNGYEVLKLDNFKSYMLEFLFIVAGVLTPMIFHVYGISGTVFLPMHWTVYCAGLIYGYKVGAFTGLTIPLMNHFITGMPLIPVLPFITLEITTYGFISGLLREKTKFSNTLILAISMISGRMAYFSLAVILKGLSQALPFVVGIWKLGIISSIAQIIFIPILIKAIRERF